MNNYKITNITNILGKRDINLNSTLNIDFVDGMERKTVKLSPGKSMILKTNSLPLSVHRLRLKNLIIVEIVSDKKNKPLKVQDKKEAKKIVKNKITDNKKESDDDVESKKTKTKKRTTIKSDKE